MLITCIARLCIKTNTVPWVISICLHSVGKRSKQHYNKPAHRPANSTTTNRHTDQQMALQQTGTQTSKWHYNKPAHRPANGTTTNRHTDHIILRYMMNYTAVRLFM